MKRFITKLLVLLIFFALPYVNNTNSVYRDNELSLANTFQSGCWDTPTAPGLSMPIDDYNSQANLEITFSWTESISGCPDTNFEYNLQIYNDSGSMITEVESGYSSNLNWSHTFTSEGEYWWRVQVTDQDGSVNTSGVRRIVLDSTEPTINNINYLVATPNESNAPVATITWETNELSTSNLEWTTDHLTWNQLPADLSADQTSHQRQIESLLPETVYYFKVTSSDQVGNSATSGENSFETDNFRLGTPGVWPIVINEFLPNPTGADNASMPNGEWVELYNKGSINVDLSGWFLTDASYSHKLPITTINSATSNSATSGLLLAPGEFMVVYRNGDADFTLNNGIGGDQVRLYHKNGWLMIDQHIYTVLLGDEVLENKSFARIPDGTGIWFDPIPTPLAPNQLEVSDPLIEDLTDNSLIEMIAKLPQPSLISSINYSAHLLDFTVNNLENFVKLSYELIYQNNEQTEGVIGSVNLSSQQEYSKQIVLGTCSTGGTCVYHENITELKLQVELVDKNGQSVFLE